MSDRRLPFDGARNLRDIGGYPLPGGRRVRRGLVYRSDNLAGLTDADLERFARLGLRTVVDLRVAFERGRAENRLPAGQPIETLHVELQPKGGEDLLRGVRAGNLDADQVQQGIVATYRSYVVDHAREFRRVMEAILTADRLPLLVHCTSGKDRTGFAIAVLLLALGADRATVMADYLLTNRVRRDVTHLFGPETPAGVAELMTSVQAAYLEAAFEQIESTHGTVATYLQDALGIGPAERQRLTHLLTEEAAAPGELTVYPFDHDHGVPARTLKPLLGGKGAGLAEMTRALGMAVPPGFTLPLPIAQRYRETGWPRELDALLDEHMDRLAARMGRRFGDPRDPLLVAVRSGAPVSMPGMLDTVLNLGLNDDTVVGLAQVSGDERFAWDSYRRFVQMFATTVMGVEPASLPALVGDASPADLRAHVGLLREVVRAFRGEDVPASPREQLHRTVRAVFASWDSARARAYRAKEGIDEAMGTAVNVQAMVFGNRGDHSGTGVVFTRDPATGAPGLYGDYLPRAQGEDVVAGTAHTLPIAQLEAHAPAVYAELTQVLRRLEVHYRDMCDVELTVEDGHLWLLQTRTGKRSAVAAVKIAVDLSRDPEVRLTTREALERVPPELRQRARQELLAGAGLRRPEAGLLATGLGASPGRVSGCIVLDAEAAADADTDVILVRPHTSPEDVAGMAASVGILTTSGGLVSHAAVVARGWGIPAVVGARDVVIEDDTVIVRGERLRAGDVITIDGSTGEVWRGKVENDAHPDVDAVLRERLPELLSLEQWAREHDVHPEKST